MSEQQIIAQAKAEALRDAASMLDGGTSAARMLARMAGEYEAAADAEGQKAGSYVFGDDGRGRLFVEDRGDHLFVRTYAGAWTLEDFFGACINASLAEGKPAVFRDELGVETWFHRNSAVAERIQYSVDQRAGRIAMAPVWSRIQRMVNRYI